MKMLKPKYLPNLQSAVRYAVAELFAFGTNGQALHEKICRKSPNQESKIKERAQPIVLRSDQFEIISNAKDGRVA